MTKPKANPKKGGQPTKYDSARHPELGMSLSLLGADEPRIAELLEISHSTLKNWKNRHPEFMAAIKGGKQEADAKVASAMYQRACGYKTTEQQAIKIKLPGGGEGVHTVEITKELPPETAAGIFWLTNRNDNWKRDASKSKDGKDADALTPDTPLTEQEKGHWANIGRRFVLGELAKTPPPSPSTNGKGH